MLKYVIGAALLSLILGLLVAAVTYHRWPQIASTAMGLVKAVFGVLAVWVAVATVQEGYVKGDPSSRYFRTSFTRESSPVIFWLYVSLFGVPGVLLVLGTLASIWDTLRRPRG